MFVVGLKPVWLCHDMLPVLSRTQLRVIHVYTAFRYGAVPGGGSLRVRGFSAPAQTDGDQVARAVRQVQRPVAGHISEDVQLLCVQ